MRFIRDRFRLATDACDAGWESRLRPGRWSVEAGLCPPGFHKPEILLAAPEGADAGGSGLALSLSSGGVLKINAAQALLGHAAAAGCHVGPRVMLALHELMLNAAIHGNLGVSSGPSACWPDLSARNGMIKAALADPTAAARAVTVALFWTRTTMRLAIADEGEGYPAEAIPPPPRPGKHRAAGNGLRIARAAGEVSVTVGGRCTTLVVCRMSMAAIG